MLTILRRVDTAKNWCVYTAKKGRVDTAKMGRVDTAKKGRVDTLKKVVYTRPKMDVMTLLTTVEGKKPQAYDWKRASDKCSNGKV